MRGRDGGRGGGEGGVRSAHAMMARASHSTVGCMIGTMMVTIDLT